MIERYSTPEMIKVWSEINKYNLMTQIEIEHIKSLEKFEIIPQGSYDSVKNIIISLNEIKEQEKLVAHDVAAFVKVLEKHAGKAGKYIHLGLTSSDVIDSAFSIQCCDTYHVIQKDLMKLIDAISIRMEESAGIQCVGRTHGRWAEPIFFYRVLGGHFEEFWRCLTRLDRAYSEINVGKMSGPVGDNKHLSPVVENETLKAFGLIPQQFATQIIPRDIYAQFFMTFAYIANAIERFATNIRNLQRDEIAEVFEPYDKKNQQGSSSMPHKRNPILCENLCGISRIIRGHTQTLNENTVLWHERDISNSSVERIIVPDLCNLTHFSILRMTKIVEGMEINKEKMKENLEKAQSVINSSTMLTQMILNGSSRQEAYEIIKNKTQESI
jgi:adenylosuccinate lyase